MKRVLLLTTLLVSINLSRAENVEFETAFEAVANMRVGWNLGNTLDATSTDTTNMWIKMWTEGKIVNYETAWGQPVTKPELFRLFREAGFNAIRVPVTWFEHLDCDYMKSKPSSPIWSPYKQPIKSAAIDPAWMKRVHEIVDYVVNEGMYCIINVHHDTGAHNAAWVVAETAHYYRVKDMYEELWRQIAEEFKDYGHLLLFESYNEMLDSYGSWSIPSTNSPGGYSVAKANDSFQAINMYAQSFVNAVRATGGNNLYRNLIVNTYGASPGGGATAEDKRLNDAVTKFVLPTDVDDNHNHLIVEVHFYQQTYKDLVNCKQSVVSVMDYVKTRFIARGTPVIIGEWGSLSNTSEQVEDEDGNLRPYNDYLDNRKNTLAYSKYFMQQAKKRGIATFYWMGLSDGKSRDVPEFNEDDLREAIITGYYGSGGYVNSVEMVEDTNEKRGSGEYIYRVDGVMQPSWNIAPGIYIRDGKKYYSK